MAFIDRIVEHPGRYILTNATTGVELGTFDLVRAEGEVTTEGTLLNAANLNTQTQLDNTVQNIFETAGMASGAYQNGVSDALGFLISSRIAYIVGTGTSNSFKYWKWSDGRLEAERIWNIGQVTISNTETSTTKVSGEVTIPTPSIMTSGEVEVAYVGNSSNSAVYLERVTRTSFRLAKNTTANVTTQNNTFVLRLVNGRWM